MLAKVFVKGVQMGNITPCLSRGEIRCDEFDANMAANMAKYFGALKGKNFQSTEDKDGAYIIASRYSVVAVVVPEGHPQFGNSMVMTPAKLPK